MSKKEKKLVVFLLVSRLCLVIGTYLFIDGYINTGLFTSFSNFLDIFPKRWDGSSYTFIAQNGYVTTGVEKYFIVFPPLFPIIVKILSNFISPSLSGLVLSNTLFIAGGIMFYKLLRIDYSEELASWAVILLAIFPTSYFFSVSYPESLFLLLFALTYYFARKDSYFLASFIAGLATLTKPFGILLFAPLVIELFKSKSRSLEKALPIVIFFFASISIYLLTNFVVYKNIYAFRTFLQENWQKDFAPFWKGILDSWKRGLSAQDSATYKYIVGYAEALASTAAWVFTGLSFSNKLKVRLSYSIYLLLGTIMFTSTSFILSSPRYLLSLPPFFIVLAILINKKPLKIVWSITSMLLLFYFSIMFAQGRWAF